MFQVPHFVYLSKIYKKKKYLWISLFINCIIFPFSVRKHDYGRQAKEDGYSDDEGASGYSGTILSICIHYLSQNKSFKKQPTTLLSF